MSVLILVVDDEPDVVDLFRQQFRRDVRSGRFSLAFAHSGAEALDRLDVPDETTVILVLSDINMPGMTGLDLLPRIKAKRPDLPVIMVSAYGDPETRRLALEKGAADLLTKPVDFAALRQTIDRRLAEVPAA